MVPESKWNASLQIPTQLFEGRPLGPIVAQTYTVWRNGTFSVSDDSSNSFTFGPLAGFPATQTSTTLIGNSTTAVENILGLSLQGVVENITTSYSVRHQSCQPAGLKITISGYVDWQGGSGELSLPFESKPTSVDQYRAYFGNNSGVALGFDWSDSAAFGPSFAPETNSLSWSVGDTFYVDPVTVTTTSNFNGVAFGNQGRVFQALGRFWAFFGSGTAAAYFASSSDGVTWTSATSISTSASPYNFQGWSFYVSGSTVYRAVLGPRTGWSVYYDTGTLHTDGTITWGTETSFTVDNNPCSDASVVVDSSGTPWIGFYAYDAVDYGYLPSNTCRGSYGWEVWKGTSWTNSFEVMGTSLSTGPQAGTIVPLTGGKLATLIGRSATSAPVGIFTYSGGMWSSEHDTSSSYYLYRSAFTTIGDTVEACMISYSGGTISYTSFPYGGSWSSPVTLDTATVSGGQCAIESDGVSGLTALYTYSTSTIKFKVSLNYGTSWGPSMTLTSAESNIQGLAGSGYATMAGNSIMGLWVTGSSSPYNVRFSWLPPVVTQATISPSSPSRGGLSPYEGYFKSMNEYVSPGSGLLAVQQTDFTVPGRGLSISLSRTYSEPYAFVGGTPFQYDNFTLSNLGIGWALDLPWMGANFLHLPGGQIYRYAWSGNTFEYHGPTDFKLVSSGGTYTLYLKDGTLVQFNSAEQLTSITDRTGNNALSFSYGTNGYISQITDATGRTTAFSYDTNNRLHTVTSASRTWTYAYSGSDLTSVTDPLGRVTTYQYSIGTNSWLVSAVIYPTGGKGTYSYATSTIGTDEKSYLVSARNVYSSSTALSQTDSISYTVNSYGSVAWSNTTISDGVHTQGYENANFQSALMKTYDKNSTGGLVRTTENDFDTVGRVNETKLISPSGSVLAYSTFAFDSWGNEKYVRDNIGQQTWYSYANTDSSNAFGSSGCSASFYTQTISSNIHDALVGQCAYQNGGGSAQVQTYYKYDSNGNLLETKSSTTAGGSTLTPPMTATGTS